MFARHLEPHPAPCTDDDFASSLAAGAVPLAAITRGELIESVHYGHAVTFTTDGVACPVGAPDTVMYVRSTAKPAQALAMVRAGLELPPHLLALVCSSHSGETMHRAGVLDILARFGLTEEALQCTPCVPVGEAAAREWQAAGRQPAPIAGDCSGKHAGMLATCLVNGWDTQNYLDVEHPLQRAIRDSITDLFGGASPISVDGCGAPVFAHTLTGLAAGYRRLALAREGTAEHTIADCMRRAPHMIGGANRPVTDVMLAIPGAIAKDGAEGVVAFALPDGRAAAIKTLDGGQRANPQIMAEILKSWGVGDDHLWRQLRHDALGHGKPVGVVRARPFGDA